MQQAHQSVLNPYNAVANLMFNKHLNHWHYNCKDSNDKCLICHNTSRDKPHDAKNCLILKKFGLKLVKCSLADTDTASKVCNDGPLPAPLPAPVTALPLFENCGSGTAPGAFTVTTDPNSYNLGDDFDYEGKLEGKVYNPSSKHSQATYLYLPIPNNLCMQVSVETSSLPLSPPSVAFNHLMLQSSCDPISVWTISC